MDLKTGLWSLTEDNIYLLPAHDVITIHPNYQTHLRFLGRLMAKALLEDLFIEVNLAPIIFHLLLDMPVGL